MEDKGLGNPPAKYISALFTLQDNMQIKDLTELSVALYDGDNLLSKNTLNQSGFKDHANASTTSTSFILGTKGNAQYAWDRGAYAGGQPTKIVIEYTKSGKRYEFISNNVAQII